tara:strand:+ start:45 stop:341 length:297 start_codon:yes stop_codon:yes gene_type:complete
MRAMPVDQTQPTITIAEQHQIFTKNADGDNGPVTGQLIGEGDRLPVTAHQCAARRAIIGLGQLSVYLGGKHDASCHHENKSVFLPGARFSQTDRRRQI